MKHFERMNNGKVRKRKKKNFGYEHKSHPFFIDEKPPIIGLHQCVIWRKTDYMAVAISRLPIMYDYI